MGRSVTLQSSIINVDHADLNGGPSNNFWLILHTCFTAKYLHWRAFVFLAPLYQPGLNCSLFVCIMYPSPHNVDVIQLSANNSYKHCSFYH